MVVEAFGLSLYLKLQNDWRFVGYVDNLSQLRVEMTGAPSWDHAVAPTAVLHNFDSPHSHHGTQPLDDHRVQELVVVLQIYLLNDKGSLHFEDSLALELFLPHQVGCVFHLGYNVTYPADLFHSDVTQIFHGDEDLMLKKHTTAHDCYLNGYQGHTTVH